MAVSCDRLSICGCTYRLR